MRRTRPIQASLKPSVEDKLFNLLSSDEIGLTGQEIAELIWLADKIGVQAIDHGTNPGDDTKDDVASIEDEAASEASPLEIDPEDQQQTPQAEITPAPVEGIPRLTLPDSFHPIPVREASAIANPLALAKALRPFAQKVATGSSEQLDEKATVEAIAETGTWQAILKPTEELWLDVALVFDRSPSMALWQKVDQEVQRLLAKYGEFRDVRLWQLQPSLKGINFCSRTGKIHQPKELLTGDRRRLVVVISDCMGDTWQRGEMQDFLKIWATQLPTVILQVFPERLWARTALRPGAIVTLQGKQAGVPSQRLIPHARSVWDKKRVRNRAEDSLTFPVVSLDPISLANLAAVITGQRQQRVLGLLWDNKAKTACPAPSASRQPSANSDPLIAKRLSDFEQFASDEARHLATLLASAPVITLPIIRLIKQAPELKQADIRPISAVHIAEILGSGLFQPKSPPSMTFENAERITYELLDPQLRDTLRAGTKIRTARDVVEAVSEYVAEGFGKSLEQFWALLRLPHREQKAGNETEEFLKAFAQVTADILRGMGGEFTRIAEELEQRSDLPPDPPSDDAFLSRFNREPVRIAVKTLEILEGEAEDQFLNLKALFTGDRDRGFSNSGIDIRDDEIRQGQVTALESGINEQNYAAQALFIFEQQQKNRAFKTEQWSGETVFVNRQGEVVERAPVTAEYYEVDLINDKSELKTQPPAELQRLRMMVIPGGILKREDDRVLIEPFLLGQTPVTQAQWWALATRSDLKVRRDLNPNPSNFTDDWRLLWQQGESHWRRPVEKVSWYDAMEYCERLAKLTNGFYCLPTEWQWQYACQGLREPPDSGEYPPFHFGETLTDQLANYRATITFAAEPKGQHLKQTTPVERYPANAYGLQDLHGNVWEWTLNLYKSETPEAANLNTDYQGKITTGNMYDNNRVRVLRGGSWSGDPRSCRSANRDGSGPDVQDIGNGFRVACRCPRS